MDDLEAIKQLRARYTRSIDTKDWKSYRETLADDFSMTSHGEVQIGADHFVEYLKEALGEAVTVHHAHMPEIELTSKTSATGIWAMEDHVRWPDGRELHGFGHYHDEYVKIADRWYMKSSNLTRLRVDAQGFPEVG